MLKNIALVGHMGSGKTTLGKLISKKLNYIHLDSDELIEKHEKKSINEIFTNNGEPYFRIIEEQIILNLINKQKTVLSLGGGSILSKKVRDYLKNQFITVFIDVELNIIIERLKKSRNRPLLNKTDIKKKIIELDNNRRAYYLLSDIKLKNFKNPFDGLKNFLIQYSKFYDEKNN
tara:strand:+ start:393 stop:917 length:525 start_codon:yes stop_codon:yes gene_type:complete